MNLDLLSIYLTLYMMNSLCDALLPALIEHYGSYLIPKDSDKAALTAKCFCWFGIDTVVFFPFGMQDD